MNKIQWIPVSGSSQIIARFYDEENQRLHLKFKGNKAYAYENFPKEKYLEMITSESIGKYFHANIKTKFNFSKTTNG